MPNPEPRPPRPGFPAALRTLALIIGIDLLAGTWLGIHHETAFEFFVGQAPLIGVAGILWAFLPKGTKDQFGEWLQWWLTSPVLQAVLVVALAALAIVTFFRVSASVASLEGGVASTLYLAPSRGGRPPADSTVLDSAAFNRLTVPVSFSRMSLPAGIDAWIYTPTAISKTVVRLRPWQPADLTYPSDFDSLATIAVLPGGWLFNRLGQDTAHVVILGVDDPADTVATLSIQAMGGVLVAFPQRGQPAQPDTARWVSLLARTGDSARASMVRRWAGTRVVPARRPIRKGERLDWVLAIGADSPRSDRLVVHDVVSNLYLPD